MTPWFTLPAPTDFSLTVFETNVRGGGCYVGLKYDSYLTSNDPGITDRNHVEGFSVPFAEPQHLETNSDGEEATPGGGSFPFYSLYTPTNTTINSSFQIATLVDSGVISAVSDYYGYDLPGDNEYFRGVLMKSAGGTYGDNGLVLAINYEEGVDSPVSDPVIDVVRIHQIDEPGSFPIVSLMETVPIIPSTERGRVYLGLQGKPARGTTLFLVRPRGGLDSQTIDLTAYVPTAPGGSTGSIFVDEDQELVASVSSNLENLLSSYLAPALPLSGLGATLPGDLGFLGMLEASISKVQGSDCIPELPEQPDPGHCPAPTSNPETAPECGLEGPTVTDHKFVGGPVTDSKCRPEGFITKEQVTQKRKFSVTLGQGQLSANYTYENSKSTTEEYVHNSSLLPDGEGIGTCLQYYEGSWVTLYSWTVYRFKETFTLESVDGEPFYYREDSPCKPEPRVRKVPCHMVDTVGLCARTL